MSEVAILEKIFTSTVAICIVLAIGLIWLARRYLEKDRLSEKLYERMIRILELRNATNGDNAKGKNK